MLESNVLVLNRLFQAIQVTTVKKAFCLLYKGHVRAVNPDYSTCAWEDWVDVPPQGPAPRSFPPRGPPLLVVPHVLPRWGSPPPRSLGRCRSITPLIRWSSLQFLILF